MKKESNNPKNLRTTIPPNKSQITPSYIVTVMCYTGGLTNILDFSQNMISVASPCRVAPISPLERVLLPGLPCFHLRLLKHCKTWNVSIRGSAVSCTDGAIPEFIMVLSLLRRIIKERVEPWARKGNCGLWQLSRAWPFPYLESDLEKWESMVLGRQQIHGKTTGYDIRKEHKWDCRFVLRTPLRVASGGCPKGKCEAGWNRMLLPRTISQALRVWSGTLSSPWDIVWYWNAHKCSFEVLSIFHQRQPPVLLPAWCRPCVGKSWWDGECSRLCNELLVSEMLLWKGNTSGSCPAVVVGIHSRFHNCWCCHDDSLLFFRWDL